MNAAAIEVADNKIVTVWECEDCKEVCEVTVDFFQDNGTPMCVDCNTDMNYDRTYLLL